MDQDDLLCRRVYNQRTVCMEGAKRHPIVIPSLLYRTYFFGQDVIQGVFQMMGNYDCALTAKLPSDLLARHQKPPQAPLKNTSTYLRFFSGAKRK